MPRDSGREIRPGAPAEYDVLVFQQHLAEGRFAQALAALERAVEKDSGSAYLHRRLAELYARNTELERAVQHARVAHDIDPSDDEGRNLLAQLYRITRDVEGAEELLLGVEGEPIDSDSAFLLYQLQLEVDDVAAAVETSRWMTEHEPEAVRGWIAYANALQKQSHFVEAEQALRRALEAEPDNLRIYAALARSKRDRGDSEGAVAVYREMLERQPDHHATLIELAEAQMGDEDLEGAIETFEQIEENYPRDLQSVTRLGFLLYEARRFEAAIERFERTLEASPQEYEVLFFLGVSQRRANREEQAVLAFEQIPPAHQYYSEARTQIAAVHERRGRYDEALVEIERAVEADPSRELELYAATLRAKSGDFDGAVAYLEERLEESPDDDTLHYNLGVIYGEADRHEEAIAHMERALELNAENADALNFIGYTWAERGENLDGAEEYIARALELRPDNGYIIDSLGWVYYMRGRPLIESGEVAAGREWIRKALEKLERANELTGGDPVISEHMGDAYLLLDERKRALDEFEEAARMGPRPSEQPELQDKLETLRREFE